KRSLPNRAALRWQASFPPAGTSGAGPAAASERGWEVSIATKAPVSETRIGFTGVGFDVYERLIRATPARTAVRMAYDGKDLEIMVKGPVHDHYGRLLDRLITAVAVVLGIRRQALGETTWIRPKIERGLEADQCYVFDAAKLSTVGMVQKHPFSGNTRDLSADPDRSRVGAGLRESLAAVLGLQFRENRVYPRSSSQ